MEEAFNAHVSNSSQFHIFTRTSNILFKFVRIFLQSLQKSIRNLPQLTRDLSLPSLLNHSFIRQYKQYNRILFTNFKRFQREKVWEISDKGRLLLYQISINTAAVEVSNILVLFPEISNFKIFLLYFNKSLYVLHRV